jgi:hypothetical protein
MVGMSALVSASENAIKVGQPINTATGEVADSFKANDMIAIPVDIDTTTGGLTAYGVIVDYNDEYITPEVDASSDEVYDALSEYGSLEEHSSGSGLYGIINCLKQRGTKYYGTITYNPETTGKFLFNWYYTETVSVISGPEAYMLFTVKKDVDASALNVAVAAALDSDYNYVQDSKGGLANTKTTETSEAIANACAGAVKLNVDTTKLDKWLQKLYVSIDGGDKQEINQGVENGTSYSFPVRITSTKTDEHTVTFYADFADTETGAATDTYVKVGEQKITLDSPTSYTAVDYAK